MKKLLFLFATIMLLMQCSMPNDKRNHKKIIHKTQHVTCYTTHDDNGNLVWWYLLLSSNNSNCYYYSSPVEITNFSTINFTQSLTVPINTNEAQEQPGQEIAQDQLTPDMQAEFADNADYFGGMAEEEMGDYEGGQNDNSTDNSSESDAGSSGDSGGGDSGGGDGGGGDGGGGGGGD